jgi:hypothetical protein
MPLGPPLHHPVSLPPLSASMCKVEVNEPSPPQTCKIQARNLDFTASSKTQHWPESEDAKPLPTALPMPNPHHLRRRAQRGEQTTAFGIPFLIPSDVPFAPPSGGFKANRRSLISSPNSRRRDVWEEHHNMETFLLSFRACKHG